VAATDHGDRETGLSLQAVNDLEPYWEAVRRVYAPFEAGLPAPTGRVYRHEIPGGQLSNLRQQAIALGLGTKFEQIEQMYAAANDILGNIVKVTPSSKVVGDLALHLVAVGADPEEFEADPGRFDVPDSVIGFLSGELGDPPGGWPEPFRTRALEGRARHREPADLDDDDRSALGASSADRRATLNRLLFPGPAREFDQARQTYSDLSVLPSRAFFYGLENETETVVEIEEGKTLILGVEAVSDADARGLRSVMCTINGQLRPVQVRDRSVAGDSDEAEKADPGQRGHVAVPYDGVVTPTVAEGDTVEAGQAVATVEAMKMESSITTPVSGSVERLVITGTRSADGGDLVCVVAAATDGAAADGADGADGAAGSG
jgi:pyruvate carboxylase